LVIFSALVRGPRAQNAASYGEMTPENALTMLRGLGFLFIGFLFQMLSTFGLLLAG
jgi:hypothetical protein